MQIVVAGCGKVGSGFALVMSAEGHDVSVIDDNNTNFQLLGPNFRGLTVWGSPIDEEILEEAGIETADAFVAATPDDNINTMACQVSKEIFHVSKIVARIQDPVREEVLYQFGVRSVCPTNRAVEDLRAMVLGGHSSRSYFFDLSVGIDFEYLKVDLQNDGNPLMELPLAWDVMALGIMREGQLILAKDEPRMVLGDEVILIRKIRGEA